jgi:hypothetical protein
VEGKFKVHLSDLTEWNNGNTVIIGKIRNKLYEHTLYVISYCAFVSSMLTCCYSHNAGAWNLEATSHVSNDAKFRAQQELEGQTGDTDSKAEVSE